MPMTDLRAISRDGLVRSYTTKLALPWESKRWRKPIQLGLLVLNFVILAKVLSWPDWRVTPDWIYWAQLPEPGSGASPYDLGETLPGFIYSPVAAWLLQPLSSMFAPFGMVILHFVALLALPRRLGLIVAISVPFWIDLLWGNVFTFVFVAAYFAMRGNRIGVLAYLTLTMLMPRPLQVPLFAWLLWTQPWSRLPFAGIFLGHAAMVALSGFGADWIATLTTVGGRDNGEGWNFGPTRLLGNLWFIVGVPLAVYLFRRHPHLAGLALSPYVLGQYWLLAFVEKRQ